MQLTLLVLTALLGLSQALFLGSHDHKAMEATNWDNLKVTWGINPLSSQNFVAMPRTQKEAIAQGWTPEKNCSEVNGNRYMFAGDRAVLLVFNTAGNIAAIATAIPKGLPYNFPSKQIAPLFNDEGDSWTITGYFSDPATVCAKDVRQSTGDRLVIKGSGMELDVPLAEANITSRWTLGQCFWTMGVHYWADVDGKQIGADTQPDSFMPLFLQYNKGKLNGFGWGFNAMLKSTRFEHPTPSVLGQFMKVPPKFFSDSTKSGGLTTLHIYMDSTPQLNFC